MIWRFLLLKFGFIFKSFIITQVKKSDDIKPDEPFIPPLRRFERIEPPKGKLKKWCLAGLLEQFEKLFGFSGYFTGLKSLENLEKINSLGFQSAEMERRLQLLRIVHKKQVKPILTEQLKTKTEDNLNNDIWVDWKLTV